MRRWLDRMAERRDERSRDRYERGYVVAGVYIGNTTPSRRVDVMDVPPPVPSSRLDGVPDDYDG